MRVVLLGAAALMLSACSSGHACPMHVSEGGISFDTRAYVPAHPAAAELCLSPGSCRPVDRARAPVRSPGTERVDFTITTAAGEVLLHATADVRVRYRGGSRGCDDRVLSGSVTVAADGRVIAS